MTTDFDVVVDRDADGFYVASVPALHGCQTQARSFDEVMERVKEDIASCVKENAMKSQRSWRCK